MTPLFSGNFVCREYEGNIGEDVEQDESHVMKWEQYGN